MANVILSKLNPVHFVDIDTSQIPEQYRSKHFDDWQWPHTILPWQQSVSWEQVWQQNDEVKLQLTSELGPVRLYIVNEDGATLFTVTFTQGIQNVLQPSYWIYECGFSLNAIPEGRYLFVLEIGSGADKITMQSCTQVIAENVDDSVLLQYKHHKFRDGVYFETGIEFHFRTVGTLKYEKPASNNVMFEDQEADLILLASKTFNIWKLFCGGPEGCPDFLVPLFNGIFACSEVRIDGRYYVKAGDSAALERSEQEGYPMSGWAIELRERNARASRQFQTPGGQLTGGIIAVVNVEAKGFVNDDQGGTYYNVQDVD